MIFRIIVGCFLSGIIFFGHAAPAGSSDLLESHFRNVDTALAAGDHQGAIKSLRTIEKEYAGRPEIAQECATRVLPLIEDSRQPFGIKKYALWIHARAAISCDRAVIEKHMKYIERALCDTSSIAFQAVATLQVFQGIPEWRSFVIATLQSVARKHYSRIVVKQANKRLALLGQNQVSRVFRNSRQGAAAVDRCRAA